MGAGEQLACAECGSADELWAWYSEPTRQTITAWLNDAGELEYDYTGLTDSGEDASDDDGYTCGNCGAYTETLEELLGLPPRAQARARSNVDTHTLSLTLARLHEQVPDGPAHEVVHQAVRLLHTGPQDEAGDEAWLAEARRLEQEQQALRDRLEQQRREHEEGGTA